MTSSPPSVATPFMSSSTATSIGLPATLSRRNAPRPSPGRTRSTAVATYLHSRTGSLSPASSVTQASAASRSAHQARTAVVLPYPAGAATSVSGASRPASSARRTRGRSTKPWRALGTASLASTSSEGGPAPAESRRRAAMCACGSSSSTFVSFIRLPHQRSPNNPSWGRFEVHMKRNPRHHPDWMRARGLAPIGSSITSGKPHDAD